MLDKQVIQDDFQRLKFKKGLPGTSPLSPEMVSLRPVLNLWSGSSVE